MKNSLFAQAPYRYLPEDFEQHHESVCDVPYSLTTREGCTPRSATSWTS
jgi:hypothetical protein